MILCIDTKALKTSPKVQKDIDIEDLLNNHTKYCQDVKEALECGYVPLDFSTSIRSMYSNLVVQRNIEDKHKYYINTLKRSLTKGLILVDYKLSAVVGSHLLIVGHNISGVGAT